MAGENQKTVAVGMSGGVDSSVAAYLLKQQGYDIVGVTMKIWKGGEGNKEFKKSGCYGPGEAGDIEAAQKVAKELGIPHHVLDLHTEYDQTVLKYFREEYLSGKTPNPCVVCNQKIKFGLLLDKAQQSDIAFDFFATGHYARIDPRPKTQDSRSAFYLRKAIDTKKDQTYFLYRLTQEQLAKVIFPLGGLLKDEVKKIASQIGFKDLADKPESQDFYEGDCYGDFFEHGDSQPGDIIDTSGHVLGQHNGFINYTIGQRKGLNIGGLKEPLYVIALDSQNNKVIVGPREKLMAKALIAEDLNWISIPTIETPLKATAKIRSTQSEKPCTITSLDVNRVRVDFDEPQMAITPGQSIVFYSGDIVLGGGVIQQSVNN
jgi:tRNA-specific 2-thiouridylase